MRFMIRLFALALSTLVLVRWAPGVPAASPSLASHLGGAAAFSIDIDPFSSPANTATSLGTREACGRIDPNGIQDADEDAVDAITADVTVKQIPSDNAMLAFTYALQYDETELTVLNRQSDFLLASATGSQLFDVSDPVPDNDNNGLWYGTVVDTGEGSTTYESGSGVLQRITVGADGGATAGVYEMRFLASESGHLNGSSEAYLADTLESARLAVNIACPPTDSDGDKVYDVDEAQCGSDPYSAASRPERIDGIFAGVSDDGDAEIDEALPANIPMADCDGDGFTGTAENFVYAPSTQGDQDPCGTAPSAAPFNVPIGWPADLKSGGIPDSTDRITVGDLTSFLAPVRRLDTSPGDAGYDPRWDVVPGNSGQAKDINSVDYNYVSTFAPAMLNSVRAMNGPSCPWP